MNVLLAGELPSMEFEAWRAALAAAAPWAHWIDLEQAHARPSEVRAAVVANPAAGTLQGLPALALVQSLWAGVDRLLADPTLPAQVPLARMVDPAMNAAMAETALWATLALHRGFFAYQRRQQQGRWQVHAQQRADDVTVAVLGYGQMGRTVARSIVGHGYRVTAWRLRGAAQGDAGVAVVGGAPALQALLPQAQIVINLLPLTPETCGLLDRRFFAALPARAAVVNLARGAHVVDADLLAALDSGHLRHAVLDVFPTEPLPAGHAYWRHPAVTLLPHAAALTDRRSAAAVVAANLRALRDGRPLAHLVDRGRGY